MTSMNIAHSLTAAAYAAVGNDKLDLRLKISSACEDDHEEYGSDVDAIIDFIESYAPGKGIAGRALRAVCAEADRLGITLGLLAEAQYPGSEDYLEIDELIAWYERNGFVETEEHSWMSNTMIRRPKRAALAA